MFGLIVTGRTPDSFVQVDQMEFVCEVQDAESIKHIVVFMTGGEPLPEGLGASVYLSWNKNGQESGWNFLGAICNNKPSAIFKVSQASASESSSVFGSSMEMGSHGSARVGIKVEQLQVVEGRQADASVQVSTQSTLAEFGEKMLASFSNYAQSYVVTLPKPNGLGSADFIPLSALQDWVSNFSRRFKQNPNFWKSLH